MGPVERGRWREHAVLAAGLGSALALGWAGVVLHGSAGAAGEVALARLAGEVSDTVVAEWGRMLRASERPVEPAGEVFRWRADEPELEPLELRERRTSDGLSVLDTLLAESERLEWVEGDPEAALELVLEALAKDPASSQLPEGRLRALQLAVRLERLEIAREQWDRMRAELDLSDARDGLPYLALGWLALPEELRAGSEPSELFPVGELERMSLDEDRLVFGEEGALVRFELAPMIAVLLDRLGVALPSLERRKVRAFLQWDSLPVVTEDGNWHPLPFRRGFLARAEEGEVEGFFHGWNALTAALRDRLDLPGGFGLDFSGENEELGEPVRPLTPLPGSKLAFVLRHDDPQRIVRGEAARLALQRAGLFALALACAAGGVLTARLLRRERALAALRTSFIAGVSHDLRTPLASILLLAENLEAGRIGEEQRGRYHVALRREAERLRRLIDDVLDFPRLERGQETHLEREEVDLPRFLGELAQDLGQRVLDARRSFALEQGPVPGTAQLDAHAVRRAVSNLVDNAIKHGAGEVRLGWVAEGERLLLTVADEGPGVPARHARAIFEPFRSFARGNGAAGGTGLGLAIVRSIARAHGGEVRLVENVPGAGGAVFELELALEETSA